MRFSTIRKWICLIATSTCLFQATVGCPDGNMIRGVASTSTQSFINGLIGLYIKAAVNQLFNV